MGQEEKCLKRFRFGFTLIELTIVIVILGILASIAYPKYSLTLERGRTAEARKAMGVIRDMELVYFIEYNQYTGTMSDMNLTYPTGACNANYYFVYAITGTPGSFNVTASRCTASGKPPQGPVGGYQLSIDPAGTVTGTAKYL